jgi:hypothetical protein
MINKKKVYYNFDFISFYENIEIFSCKQQNNSTIILFI